MTASRAAMTGRWRRRPIAVALPILAIVATIAAATALRPVGLAEVLLIVLVEVVGVSLLAGRRVAGVTAVLAFLAVNWFLVPPYGTLQIQAQENWVSLGVFLLLAVGVSSLVEVIVGSERAAAAASARVAVMAEVMRPDSTSPADSLRAFRSAMDLDEATLLAPRTGEVLLRDSRPGPGDGLSDPVVDVEVEVAPGFRVVGLGAEVMGVNREFAESLATAVVRAWESQELVAEQERSARLAEVDRARAALLASVGHDLRTPMAGIRLSVDALSMPDASLGDADRAVLLDGLRQSVIRLDELLRAVLDHSQIEAGVASVNRREVDLADVAAAAVATWESPRLRLVRGPAPVLADTDPVLLERILANVVANALVHTPEDTPVQVVVRDVALGAEVVVIDHGPGLAVGTGEVGSGDVGRDRHGMGMLIVDQLAEHIGAQVTHEPTPGGGLTVTVRVARVRADR